MGAERLVYIILVSASAALGLWFVISLGRPWRSEVPSIAWLQDVLAGAALAFDVVILLALLRVGIPWWLPALALAGQDAAFAWRLARLRAARLDDRRQGNG